MIEKSTTWRVKPWHLAVAVVALLAVAISLGAVLAGKQANKPDTLVSEVDSAPLAGPAPGQGTKCQGAYLSLVPEAGAPCNGCTAHVGDRFVFDLVAHAPNTDVVAQQAYMGFSDDVLQVVSADGKDCAPSATVSSDPATFDAELQNEVCNGPQPCNLRGQQVDAGSIAYAAGASNQCSAGCKGDIRAARIAFCATKAGDANIKWQFSPSVRQTMLVSMASKQMIEQSCYTDFKINIAAR